MPQTWSDWVALIGALLGTVTGVLSLVLSYAAIRRDRSAVSVKLSREYGFRSLLESRHPGVKYGPHRATEAPEEFFVLSAVNSGLRPVHIEKAVGVWVDPRGAASISCLLPHDVLLSEERRRTAFAVGTDVGLERHELWQIGLVDDTGREYVIYGPQFRSRFKRWRWKRERDKLVAQEIADA
jgi:hypothetical protein